MSFLVRLTPLAAPVIRRCFGRAEPDADVLQDEEIETVCATAFLPGMLDRVTGTDEHSKLSDHLAAARAETVTHAPVFRRTFRNALVRRTGFATWGHSERYGNEWRLGELAGPILHVPELRYCHTYVNWRYFGHWLTDGIPSALIDPNQGALWMPPNPDWKNAKDYLGALDLALLDHTVVHADQLIVYQDFGQGSHKRQRYETIRNRLHSRFGNGAGAADLVYLRRGATGAKRVIANELKLIEQLSARNWKIIDIATAEVEQLQRALCQARVVVSIDGSHLDHAHLTLLPGSTMVVLMPQDRFSTRQAGLCQAHRVSIGMVVLEGEKDQGYVADLDEILRTVDLVDASAAI